MTEQYPEDRWEPTDTPAVEVGSSGPVSTITDEPVDGIPDARPLEGFRCPSHE